MERPGRRLTPRVSAGPTTAWVVAGAVPLAVLVVFFVVPVAGMLRLGLWHEGRLDLAGALDTLWRPRIGRAVWFTLWSSAAATAVALLLGVPAAHVLHRLRFPGRRALGAAVLVPFVLPTVVVGVAFRTLLAPGGPLGGLGLDGSPAAIIAALAFFNVAVVVRTVGAWWESLDPRREQAAAALGAAPWQVLRTVTLPALRPAVVSAAGVVFLFCATSFGVVLTLGGARHATVETEIYLLTTQFLDLRAAAALSVVQLLAVVSLLAVSARAARPVVVDRAGRRTTDRRPAARDLPALAVTGLTLVLLALPIGTLGWRSLRDDGGWTLRHYRALAGTPDGSLVPVTTALANSLRTAVDAALIATLLGVVVAVLVTRRPGSPTARRLLTGYDAVFMLPLGVSAVTVGFGFLVALDRPPLDLRGSPWLVPVAQAMVALPLVVRVLVPVLRGVDPRQREAAWVLGAGPLRALLAVDLPVAWRPVLVSLGLAAAVSLGEFGATSFLVRPEAPTLPVLVFTLVSRPGADSFATGVAAAVVLGVLAACVVALVEQVPRAGGRR